MGDEIVDVEIIPRKIHFCWYGGKPLSKITQKNIQSWKKYCPDYDIVRWDESNSDICENRYVSEAYSAKKWAFVSDYFRLRAICDFGGIYLDTDVELIRPLDKLLCYKGFIGFENDELIATCMMGGVKGHNFFQSIYEIYRTRQFILSSGEYDMTTNVEFITRYLCKKGLCRNGHRQNIADIEIFPSEFFSPKNLKTGKTTITENTFAVHQFGASWQTVGQRFHTKVAQIIGPENTEFLKNLLKKDE